jgi:hypothetical protein
MTYASCHKLMAEGLKVDAGGVHKLLLGPLFLYDDLMSALIPGAVFLLLLLAKKVAAAQGVLALPYLGYKTKIVAGLLLAYVVGKVFQLPVNIAMHTLENVDSDWAAKNVSDHDTLYDVLKGKTGRDLIVGLIMGLFLPLNAFDAWVVSRANLGFYLSTGLALVVASLFPGDGLTVVERCAGAALLIAGLADLPRVRNDAPRMLGIAVGNAIVSSRDNYEGKVEAAFHLIFARTFESFRAEYSVPAPPAVGDQPQPKL